MSEGKKEVRREKEEKKARAFVQAQHPRSLTIDYTRDFDYIGDYLDADR